MQRVSKLSGRLRNDPSLKPLCQVIIVLQDASHSVRVKVEWRVLTKFLYQRVDILGQDAAVLSFKERFEVLWSLV